MEKLIKLVYAGVRVDPSMKRLYEFRELDNINNTKKLLLESKGGHNDIQWDEILTSNVKQFCIEHLE